MKLLRKLLCFKKLLGFHCRLVNLSQKRDIMAKKIKHQVFIIPFSQLAFINMQVPFATRYTDLSSLHSSFI